ncbi:MAG TPA: hypothetical protein VFH68_06215 [Polyangia bacterium]|nr:hypothetical protein [Polyangia bacterium]
MPLPWLHGFVHSCHLRKRNGDHGDSVRRDRRLQHADDGSLRE